MRLPVGVVMYAEGRGRHGDVQRGYRRRGAEVVLLVSLPDFFFLSILFYPPAVLPWLGSPILAVTCLIVIFSIGLQHELTNRRIIMPLVGKLPHISTS